MLLLTGGIGKSWGLNKKRPTKMAGLYIINEI